MDIFGVLRVISVKRARLVEQRNGAQLEEALRAVPEPVARPESGPPAPAQDQPTEVVEGLISLADQLVDLSARRTDPESAALVLKHVDRVVVRLLTACRVQYFCDEGPVNPARHEVVGAHQAVDPNMVGRIASTIRPGYSGPGGVIRPQQVVAWTTDEGEAPAND